jgi:hypothetical protein
MNSKSIYIHQTVFDVLPQIVSPADARERARGLEREGKGTGAIQKKAQ